ncbi:MULTISPECIES: AAA family ATPase [unclassified Bradyrhizobium]|uniref:ATP-dependent nuclease n=1 Tax=unclassified Bradyrhizobium TaxID=2631580 RepID=UPI001FFBA8CE|nr:AAA family ATPase [Bradyrhizobium sp. 30]MCK1672070.1 AAA family ATPase [Bradyrhizobium sp. 150]
MLDSLKLCLELLRSDRITGVGEKVRIRPMHAGYDWESDFPVKKQEKFPSGSSVFGLHFLLTADEADRFTRKVKSRLNGVLPIELRFSASSYVQFRVKKPGKGGKALSKKAATICEFISENLDFAHVPAIRTAETSQDLVKDLVARELRALERMPEYAKLQEQIEALQKPVLQSIAAKVKTNLVEILGASLKDVTIKLPRRNLTRAVARAADVTINDGVATSLERKGDGVKSLVAIGLLTKAVQESESAKDVISLIEEPESHLHPKAIDQLKEVLDGLKQDRQIVLTTHCPILALQLFF